MQRAPNKSIDVRSPTQEKVIGWGVYGKIGIQLRAFVEVCLLKLSPESHSKYLHPIHNIDMLFTI